MQVRRGAAALWVFSVIIAGCAGRGPRSTPPFGSIGGSLLLLGGGRKPAGFYDRFVALAGGRQARVVVLPLASAESRETGEEYQRALAAAGAATVTVLQIDGRSDAAAPSAVAEIARASGVFFTGGDQSRIAERLVDTPLLAAVRALLRRGGVVGGTSAGAACQSEVMLVGEGDEHTIRGHNIVTARGIGLFAGVIVDSHFLARQRNSRLVSAVLEHPDRVGVGIDEATAAWVKPDGTIEVLGDGAVVVYDARGAAISARDGRLAVIGLREHVLVPGQRYDLRRGRLLP